MPCTARVAEAIGPSATRLVPLSVITVATVAVRPTISRFLLRLATLKVPAVRRTTSPTLKPSVRYDPVLRVSVKLGAVPATVIDRLATLTPAVKSRLTTALRMSE